MASSWDTKEESNPVSKPGAIGSEIWQGGNAYTDGSSINLESRKFFESFDWQALASIASKVRGGLSCSYADRFSMGQFNMVRRLNFDDGVSWVARIRLPPEASAAELSKYDSRRAFDIEIAAMHFFK